MLRNVLTRQPAYPTPIDQNNPICAGLHHAVTFVHDGPAMVSMANNVRPADGTHTYSLGVRPQGRAGVFSGANGTNDGVASEAIASTSLFSTLWMGRITGAGGNGFGRMWAATGSELLYLNTTDKAFNINGGQYRFPAANNADLVIVAVVDTRVTTPVLTIYVNGVSAAITIGVGPTSAIPMSGVMVYGNISGAARALAGEEVLGMTARRKWTAGEALSLSMNPWQVFRPTPQPWRNALRPKQFYLPADAGAYT